MYRITIEKQTDNGWEQELRTTQPDIYLKFINLSGFADILNTTRAKLRYLFSK